MTGDPTDNTELAAEIERLMTQEQLSSYDDRVLRLVERFAWRDAADKLRAFPDLLAALRKLVEWDKEDGEAIWPRLHACIEDARAAIAKATGN